MTAWAFIGGPFSTEGCWHPYLQYFTVYNDNDDNENNYNNYNYFHYHHNYYDYNMIHLRWPFTWYLLQNSLASCSPYDIKNHFYKHLVHVV